MISLACLGLSHSTHATESGMLVLSETLMRLARASLSHMEKCAWCLSLDISAGPRRLHPPVTAEWDRLDPPGADPDDPRHPPDGGRLFPDLRHMATYPTSYGDVSHESGVHQGSRESHLPVG